MQTPVSLLHRLRHAPDAEGWSRFVQLYLPLVCYWCKQSGLQDADSADLSQEVFTLLWQKLPHFVYDPQKNFRSWLRSVTRNKWRELCRRRGLPLQTGESLADDLTMDDPAGARWEEEHHQYLATRALQLMKADFDTTTWQACWETTVAARPAGEVAQQLGLTVGAVYAAKARVLRRLRHELQDLW